MSTEKTKGASKGQEHYINSAKQPIEVMQLLMGKTAFLGFLQGNVIKYSMRAGYKDSAEKDITKRNQYASWYDLASKDVVIDPITASVPTDYIFKGLF